MEAKQRLEEEKARHAALALRAPSTSQTGPGASLGTKAGREQSFCIHIAKLAIQFVTSSNNSKTQTMSFNRNG